MTNFNATLEHDARLIILRELAAQPDGRLNETILAQVLDAFGHNRSRAWLRQQLAYLADLGALKKAEIGSVVIATITALGLDHVERRTVLEGVQRPRPGA